MNKWSLLITAIYIVSMLIMMIQIVVTAAGLTFMNPVNTILMFLFFQELAKLITQFIGDEDGTDSSS